MQGVEILNTIYEYASLIPIYWFLGFMGLAFVISVLGVCTTSYDVVQVILICLVVTTIVCMIVCGIGSCINTDEVIDTKYEVIISDEVSLSEFYEHYEVIDQDGKIFTVREKTDEK